MPSDHLSSHAGPCVPDWKSPGLLSVRAYSPALSPITGANCPFYAPYSTAEDWRRKSICDALASPEDTVIVASSLTDSRTSVPAVSDKGDTLAELAYYLVPLLSADEGGDADWTEVGHVVVIEDPSAESSQLFGSLRGGGARVLVDEFFGSGEDALCPTGDFYVTEPGKYWTSRFDPPDRICYKGFLPEGEKKAVADRFLRSSLMMAEVQLRLPRNSSCKRDVLALLSLGREHIPEECPHPLGNDRAGEAGFMLLPSLDRGMLREDPTFSYCEAAAGRIGELASIWRELLHAEDPDSPVRKLNGESDEYWDALAAIAENAGVEAAVAAYYDGVLVEDIVGSV